MHISYIVINCKSEVRWAIDKMSQIPHVKEVCSLFGVYDIFVKIKCSISELNDIMTNRIKKIKGITSTVTVVVIPDMGGREEDISYQAEVGEISSKFSNDHHLFVYYPLLCFYILVIFMRIQYRYI